MRAICYSGNLRTFEYCVENHVKVFGDSDVYFSLWDEFGYVDRINDAWHCMIGNRNQGLVTEKYIESILPVEFKIMGFKIERYEDVSFPYKMKSNNHLLYQYYKMEDCILMLQKDYDEVVRMRCDITIDKIKFSNKSLICNEYVWWNQKIRNKEMNEMVFTGNSDIMKRTCCVMNNIEKIDKSTSSKMLYGESVFYKHLQIENIIPESYNFNFRVIR